MRIAITGGGDISVRTAQILISQGHTVIIIESDKAVIDRISQRLDASFLYGDGSDPEILREVSPEETDVLFCLTDSDQANIIAAVVGKSLGFTRIIPRIQNPAFESICIELGLSDAIFPTRTVSRYLADMLTGEDTVELSTVIRDTARFFTFAAREDDQGPVEDLKLPAGARVVCFYREGSFNLVEGGEKIKAKDEVVVLTYSENLSELEERWSPRAAPSPESDPEEAAGKEPGENA